ncbi:MAG: Gfo/Idh/MocA family oxidoreductase [Gemmataceae bacterium]|nr:Gfo/Idh/MocA family oxidoreductase [Gemmataceae bacterium]
MSRRTNRRDFLKYTALTGTGFWVASGFELEGAQERRPGPNDRLNIGIIGAGGRGGGNLDAVARTENIVALCDVDDRRAAGAYKRHPKAAHYADFRVMLDKQRDLDAVVVSTPDHTHAIAGITAMRLGKHCYCEKPLTHSVHEARLMRETARKHRVATQMGNQGTSHAGLRTGVEVIRSGAIGDIREVHVWTNRPIWPQGMEQAPPGQPVPQGLNWDLWLGPAPQRAYNDDYVPFKWRGWWDFGTGALGDMACHTMNLPYMALRLEYPTTVSADIEGQVSQQSPPNRGCTVTYEFPARGKMPAVRLLWYERRRPPAELFQGQKPSSSGCLLIGSKGTLYSPSDYGGEYRLLPLAAFKDYQPPKPSLPRSPGHHAEWLRACKGGPAAMSNFVDYAARFTEVVLLGNVAMRIGKAFRYDHEQGRAVNMPAADQFFRREYRKGWTL